jgi:hypothetical protein
VYQLGWLGFVDGHLFGNPSYDLVLTVMIVALGSAAHGLDYNLIIDIRILRIPFITIRILFLEQTGILAISESNTLDHLSQLFIIFIILFPDPVVFNIDRFSLGVCAMDWALGYIEGLQVLDYDVGNAFDITELAYALQVGKLKVYGIYEVSNIHCIFAVLIQEDLQIECLVMRIDRAI